MFLVAHVSSSDVLQEISISGSASGVGNFVTGASCFRVDDLPLLGVGLASFGVESTAHGSTLSSDLQGWKS